MKKLSKFFAAFGILALVPLAQASTLSESARAKYRLYFEDTYNSLQCMRSESGLILDKVRVDQVKSLHSCKVGSPSSSTSPTNIAFDLLTQIAAIRMGYQTEVAQQTIDRVLFVLSQLSYDSSSGLFYTWYSTSGNPEPTYTQISSVDNLHLALALWTISEELPNSFRAVAALTLLKRMDFSVFYDSSNGLFHGALGQPWHYSYYGSESRSIYAFAYALGLIRDPKYLDLAMRNLTAEMICKDRSSKPLMRAWDGGAFQLLLPELLLSESSYSPRLAELFRNFGDYILDEGKRLGYPVPAAFSASESGIDGVTCGIGNDSCYNGKAGSPYIVATMNQDLGDPRLRDQWDAVFTPHAAILAAQLDPEKFAPALSQAESISSAGNHLYEPGFGWMDGYRVKGPYQNTVIPVVLSLDQEMIALSLAQILSPDGHGPSAAALYKNAEVSARLSEYYHRVDTELLQCVD